MPWRKFNAEFRYRVNPGSDSVVQFFDPGDVVMITTRCEQEATAAGVLDEAPPEVTDAMRRANTETVIGKDDKSTSPLRKARQTQARD